MVFSPKIYKEDDVIDFHLILKTNVDLFREYGVVVDFNNTFDRSSMKLRRSRLDAIDVVNLVLFDYSNPTYISNGRVVDSLRQWKTLVTYAIKTFKRLYKKK